MPQLSLYIDDTTMDVLRTSALVEGVSMSKYAANLIRDRALHGSWPHGYWESVYGCLSDDLNFNITDDDLHPELDDSGAWFEGN